MELPATAGACTTEPTCRPGNKTGHTQWAPFGRLYYSGTGSTPAGTYGSALSCN